jgi:thymidylate synthase
MSYASFSEAWTNELYEVLNGEESSPRGMRTVERRWRQIVVEEPMSFPVVNHSRQFRDVIGILEGLSLVGSVTVPEVFTSRVKKFEDFLDDGVFHGAYATRAYGMLGEAVHLLERDPDSRQAVVTVFDSTRDLNRIKKDIPCTIALHFMRRDSRLELNVTMRSNDVWLGTPYDFTQFAIAQASVAQALGLRPGLYVHSAGSLHLYESNFQDAARATAIDTAGTAPMPFPLWSGDGSISDITTRARRLLMVPSLYDAETPFERWARAELMK